MSVHESVPQSPSPTPRRNTPARSIRKSVGVALNIEDNVKQEGASTGKLMKGKSRRSTKRMVPLLHEEQPEPSEQELTLADEKVKYETEKEGQNDDDDKDSQISFIQNFKLESDDEEDTIKTTICMIEVQRRLYLRECERIGVIPVRAVAELTEDLKDLDVSRFHLGPKGATALAVPLHLNESIITLNMEYNDIGPYGCQAIAEVLMENHSVTDVNLAHNNIGIHGLACICRIFKSNISIVKLNLSGNRFCDASSKFLPYLLVHPFLKELRLSQNEFDIQTAKTFGELLVNNESLEYLDLSWNHFRFRSAEAIAKGIKENTGLKRLDISYNGFGPEGVAAMSKALSINTTLQELDFTHNRITDQGIDELCKGLKDNSSLWHLKIGGNALTKFAAIALVAMIQKSSSALVKLDIQDVFVDQDFLNLVNEIKQTKNLFVTHGSLEDLEVCKSKLMEAKQKATVVLARPENLGVDKPPEIQVSEPATEQAETSKEEQILETDEEEAIIPQEMKEDELEEENLSKLQIDAAGGPIEPRKTHFAD